MQRSALASLFILLSGPALFKGTFFVVLEFVLLVVWVGVSKWRIEYNLIRLILPIVLMLTFSIPSSFGSEFYPIAKDVFYVGKTIVALCVGYILARYVGGATNVFRMIVLAAVVSSIIHLTEICVNYNEEVSVFVMRSVYGVRGYFISVVGLALLLVNWRRPVFIAHGHALYWLSFALCASSVVLAFSRTFFVILIVIMMALNGLGRLKLANVAKVMFFAVFIFLMLNLGTEMYGSGKTIFSKFEHSISEVSVRDYDNLRDINLNWRGFESYKAVTSFVSGGICQMIFGHGMGSSIDLGMYMLLGENELRYIPLLHNGYLYVLVKFGVVGIFMLMLVFVMILRFGLVREKFASKFYDRLALRLSVGLGISLILATFVIAGMFNGSMIPIVVLVGLLSSRKVYSCEI